MEFDANEAAVNKSSASFLFLFFLQPVWFTYRGPFGFWEESWIHEVCRQTGDPTNGWTHSSTLVAVTGI